MSPRSRDLFGSEPSLPPGFRYQPDLISPEEESALVARVAELPFKEFEFQGYRGKRRVVSFGWQYDFTHARLHRVEDMPEFLLAVRDRAGAFAGIAAADLQHVLLTEYGPGAPIGWHRDRVSSPRSSASHSCCRVRSASGAKPETSGNASTSCSSRVQPTSSRDRPGRNGSTASRRSSSCDTRSHSGP